MLVAVGGMALLMLVLLVATLARAGASPGSSGAVADRGPGFGKMIAPCSVAERRAKLRCPDLKMRKPFDLWFSRSPSGRLVLHSANDIRSRGAGPLEVRGRRIEPNRRPKWMEAHQVIYKRGPGKFHRKPSASLTFHPIPYQGSYWKYADAAQFEMWSLNRDRQPVRRVRVGPKLDYCFRDLERTLPSPASPASFVYPGCSQDPNISRVTLGTSVGWSDVYPSNYDDNWIDVTRLKGCFLFRQLADPKNQLSELNEKNNVGKRRLRLTGSPTRIRSC